MNTIYILAGHSSSDPGAISGGHKEADLTRDLRDRISAILPSLNDDDDDNLSRTLAKLGVLPPSVVLLDIHFNAAKPSVSGSETFVKKAASPLERLYADTLSRTTSKILGIPNRGAKPEHVSPRGRLGILHTGATSVLLEVGFITNDTDRAAYFANAERLSKAIAEITQAISNLAKYGG